MSEPIPLRRTDAQKARSAAIQAAKSYIAIATHIDAGDIQTAHQIAMTAAFDAATEVDWHLDREMGDARHG